MPPQQVQVFESRMIVRGPDEIKGQVGSLAFIYTKYPDPGGNRWFVRPGYVGHEQMTNSAGMLQAFFGPEAEEMYQKVVTIGDIFAPDERCQYSPTGAKRENWDWYTIRQLAKRENLFGRAGTLCGRQVVMLWGNPPGWEAMLVEVLGYLGIGPESEAVVVVGNSAQYQARDFFATNPRGE
ncbi:hypothetical protein [Tautonia plasticadhaerens]|uniref:Uncharacterized protein n=1 Tax=Tautonia plasticadhaerens TaxID=2527974 RepID=A0A518H9R6_9BACT|nr:hypothetical protein [Tautonia plasticadhaerens]QDV37547.1 hypothetical protein ElP_54870 [Tautonia plasticadhaerens]